MNKRELFEATIEHYLAPIREYLEDTSVSEVMINGPHEIYVEREGKLEQTGARFTDEASYHAAVNNVLQYTGRSLSDEAPLIDSRLPDGSRVHVCKAPASRFGTAVTIRKFAQSMLDIDWLVELGSLSEQAADYLRVLVENERNMLVAGGTSSGKTSLLNALSRFIPHGHRIVVIEDSAELQLQQDHVISLEVQSPDRHGRGGADIRELFRSSLRLRPDRIIIGEVRGGEALDMIQAMTSGHGGSMGTLHANNPLDALSRLETMALMSKVELPLHALRAQVASAIDVVIQMNRQIGGRRLVTEISEVEPLGDDGNYRLRNIFRLAQAPESRPGKKIMQLRWTETRSSFAGQVDGDEATAAPLFETESAGAA